MGRCLKVKWSGGTALVLYSVCVVMRMRVARPIAFEQRNVQLLRSGSEVGFARGSAGIARVRVRVRTVRGQRMSMTRRQVRVVSGGGSQQCERANARHQVLD